MTLRNELAFTDDPHQSMKYEALRMKWRRELSDHLVRALNADYVNGLIDEATYDAHLEMKRRGLNSRRGRRPKSEPPNESLIADQSSPHASSDIAMTGDQGATQPASRLLNESSIIA